MSDVSKGLYNNIYSVCLHVGCSSIEISRLQVAQVVKDAFLSGSEQDQTCIRRQLRSAIARELQPCISQKGFPNFEVPELPDFDAASYPYNRQM